MIYVPMLKTRCEELRIARDMNACFSDQIIPLFEVLNEEYVTRYQVNPINGEPIYKETAKSRRRVKEKPTEDDIITLDVIDTLLHGKTAFIDFFRFTTAQYGKDVNVKRIELAWRLSRDSEKYIERIKDISHYQNLIPVISIKEGFSMKSYSLESVLRELQSANQSVALRMTENELPVHGLLASKLLREMDYLLFDIGEQNVDAKMMELEEIQELKVRGKTILLNSPRKEKLKNGDYENDEITPLIDNAAREDHKLYGFAGYGDYGGLKDSLPTAMGGSGKGVALALLYNYGNNGFCSFVNKDTDKGASGYMELKPAILKRQTQLDPNHDCPAFRKIAAMQSSGNWSTWIGIILMRSLDQMHKNIQTDLNKTDQLGVRS